MIQYRLSLHELTTQIEAACPGWLARAEQRTAAFRAQGSYAEASTIWSEVKPVYMRLQGEAKCAYCERKLESDTYGKGEQDVEHFRPKSSIKAWRLPAALRAQGVTVATPPEPKVGYHLLAYHPFNYAAACKPCNSALKKDYFPIAGTYQPHGDQPASLVSELPLLVYPLGDFEVDPESLIQFQGLSPCPVVSEGQARNRALVTIAFFKLDDPLARKNLFRERAMLLLAVFGLLERIQDDTDLSASHEAQQVLAVFLANTAPHANCLRSFVRLYQREPRQAKEIYQKVTDYVLSSS